MRLHKGLFAETLPPFLDERPGKLAWVNIDCDLYQGTVDVLRLLAPRFRRGSLLHFHELVGWYNRGGAYNNKQSDWGVQNPAAEGARFIALCATPAPRETPPRPLSPQV